jgi:predicted nucleic acid-binding protein
VTFVLDAAVTMTWCFEDEATPESEAVLDRLADEPAVVPALWSLEVSNALLAAERRRRLTEAQAVRFLDLLDALPITVDLSVLPRQALVSTARRHSLSAYDAAYLMTAELLGAPLATTDDALAAAAAAAGVVTLGHASRR